MHYENSMQAKKGHRTKGLSYLLNKRDAWFRVPD